MTTLEKINILNDEMFKDYKIIIDENVEFKETPGPVLTGPADNILEYLLMWCGKVIKLYNIYLENYKKENNKYMVRRMRDNVGYYEGVLERIGEN